MSKEAIKNFFRSQNRKPVVHKVDFVESIEEPVTKPEILTSTFNEDDEYVEEVYKADYSKYTIRLVEITDEMIRKKEQEEAYREEEEYFKRFEAYVPPPRPKEDIDDQLEKMISQIEKYKKELDEELIKAIPHAKGYVPPTKKKEYNEEFNMNARKLKSNILDLENGIKQLSDRINKQNDQWVQRRKLAYRSEYTKEKLLQLSKMQEEIFNTSNV